MPGKGSLFFPDGEAGATNLYLFPTALSSIRTNSKCASKEASSCNGQNSSRQGLKKAAVFAQKGEIEQARNHYNIILDKFPQNRRAKQGLEDLASLASKKIEKLADNQALFNIQLDRLKNLYVRGDLNKAFDYGQNLARQFPEEFMMWNVLGLVNLRLQRLNDALSAFRKAIKLNPGFSEGFNNLGATLQEQGNVEEAIAAHRHSLQLSSENSKHIIIWAEL